MCGILCTISRINAPTARTDDFTQRLKCRGPDTFSEHTVTVQHPAEPDVTIAHLLFQSTVLSLRGDTIVSQPLIDTQTGSVLCWNGEAWKIGNAPVDGNDGEILFKLLLAAAKEPRHFDSAISTLTRVHGPHAFVFYDALHCRLYYGRDCLGRRSLLESLDEVSTYTISSVCDAAGKVLWSELEANRIDVVDLVAAPSLGAGTPSGSWARHSVTKALPYGNLNITIPQSPLLSLTPDSSSVSQLCALLQASLALRVRNIRRTIDTSPNDAQVAVLFSGGLDCTVLARLAHGLLPVDMPIDLLNVAFENPRIHKSGAAISPYELCPDRITGRASHVELQQTCPDRSWNLVCINVPYSETVTHRQTVVDLMHPHNTEMDLSISYALYFASRGSGLTHDTTTGAWTLPYTTPARVLLSGLGADELFAGYTRHATAFNRHGFPALLDELGLDISRLGHRNLGRDDRVMSHWGKEVRFPYLDEDLLTWALAAPVWEKCGFGTDDGVPGDGRGEGIEPGKKVLRLLALRLGMPVVAREKKRAIQFGARTAKMEGGKTKGTDALS